MADMSTLPTPGHWGYLLRTSLRNQRFFKKLYEPLGPLGVASNAAYILKQAEEYRDAMQRAGSYPEDSALYLTYAKTDLSRILALILRDCQEHGWSLFDLLQDGIEYERDGVVKDIEEGRREGLSSHRGLHHLGVTDVPKPLDS
jgi:hypothetical protein